MTGSDPTDLELIVVIVSRLEEQHDLTNRIIDTMSVMATLLADHKVRIEALEEALADE